MEDRPRLRHAGDVNPGSGKTFLANSLASAVRSILGADRVWINKLEINRDVDLAQFLGYENLSGEFTAGRFSVDVLFRGEASDPRIVILDEWNLAR